MSLETLTAGLNAVGKTVSGLAQPSPAVACCASSSSDLLQHGMRQSNRFWSIITFI